MSQWQSYLDEHQARFVDELVDFLRIPSVSAETAHAADVERAAAWVVERLRAAGVENVERIPTAGHPVVYGDWLHAPGRPTVLIYGHFDTQPADPLHLWTSPPFEPVIREGRIYARGASDDKGNMLIPILAVEAMLKTAGALPLNVKFFLEGQEEIGSPQIAALLAERRDLFAADVVLSADGSQWSEEQPQLVLGCRGLAGLQIDVVGPNADLHSGLYGGIVQNPIHALAQLLSGLRSPEGRILVEGFYDAVRPLTDEERERIAAVPLDEQAYLRQLDVAELYGEPGYTTLERLWARPTLEVNGLWGGFQGEGIKTVLPSEAHAKITCRIVADQDPEHVIALIAEHVRRHTPPGVRATVTPLEGSAQPYLQPANLPASRSAGAVLAQMYGREPYHVRIGATLPVCDLFLRALGLHTVLFAFGLDDEQIHAPDEFFRLSSFTRGQQAYCLLLEQLAS